MKVALVAVAHPAGRGGAEVLYEGVESALSAAGHDVERVTLTCDESMYEGILEGYRAARALDLSRFDAVISTKAPSFNVRHRNHVVYLLHTVRVFYDMFDSLTDGSASRRAQRDRIRELDFSALSAVPDERRFAIGEEVAGRLLDSLGLPSRVVHPPLPDADRFHEGPFEHFLHCGRLHPWKRVDLLVRAYRSARTEVPLVITGTGVAEGDLRRLAAGDERIRFVGDVDRTRLYDLFSRALAVPFVPLREDFGYVAVEAMLSGKPVVTLSDSGEPARLVEDGVTGLVVAPEAAALASALDSLAANPGEARRMGLAGRARATRVGAAEIAEVLLGGGTSLRSDAATARTRPSRSRVLILDNQPIEPPIGGGRIRLLGLYSNLPLDLDPVYVGTYDWRGPGYRSVLHQGRLREVTVPQSEAHFAAQDALHAAEPTVGMDVTFPALSPLSAAFAERVAYEAARADVIVFSHPWVFPLIARDPSLSGKPFVYDSQNVEGRLRRSLLSGEGLSAGIAGMVEELERELCHRSAAIFACSEEDARAFVEEYGVDPDRVHVLPNGTDVTRLRPAGPEARRSARTALGLPVDGPVVLFVGSDYPPNSEAARSIATELAPRLPDVRFVIVGGCTKDWIPGEAPPNVTALGVVSHGERDAALAAADLAINPMRRGSGTNIKMLDYFSAGLPVVSTPVGARGLSRGVGSAYVLAGVEDFPARIRELLGSPAAAARISRAARLLAESLYDWRQIGAAAGRVLRRISGGAGESVEVRPEPRAEPRVAVLSTWKTRCGIADYADSMTRAFPAGASWQVYAEARSCGVAESDGVRANWEIGLADLSRLEADLEAHDVDVLLVQHNPAFFSEEALRRLLALTRARGVSVALVLHAAQGLRIDPALASELDRVDRIYVHRRADAELFAGLGVETPVRVISHGIARLPERSVGRAKSAIGLPGKFLIGHFGYLRPHKGVLELLEAFERIAPENPAAELLLLCSEYPSADSREYRARCEKRIAESAFGKRIHASFDHLPLDTAGFLLQACDVLVFPYAPSGESSSAAVRLAIAAGRPIVVSDSGIFDELRDVGHFAQSNDPDVLARAISSLQDARERAVVEARVRRFARHCAWERVASNLWGDLRAVAAERGRRASA